MIKAKADDNWDSLGYDKYLSRSLKPSDPNYRSSFDQDLMTEDATIRSSKIQGNLITKTMIVRDPTTGLDRVLIGYLKDGF